MSYLHKGLKVMAPAAPSKPVSGPSVDKGATRGGTAPTPRTLGPREG
jgi:hypothetical protein